MTPRGNNPPRRRSGFTLVELLVVIGIILILLALLFPAISAVRVRARVADTKQEISKLSSGINAYFVDFHAYPGPVPDAMLATPTVTTPPYVLVGTTQYALTGAPASGTNPVSPSPTVVTGSENLFLGLEGGLSFPNITATQTQPQFWYTAPFSAPAGPASLNPSGIPVTHPAYVPYSSSDTTYNPISPYQGLASDTSNSNIFPITGATDSAIPEFIDHFAPARPILYLRANTGAQYMLNTIGGTAATASQYDENQLTPYGWVAVTTGAGTQFVVSATDFPTTGTSYTTSDQVYFSNPAVPNTPIGKDGYILISAGPDGIYGTKDDIIYGD